MEAKTTNPLRAVKHDLDELAAHGNVLPDSWEGHARLAIRESDAVPQQIEQSAIEKAVALSEKSGVTPEEAANRLIAKIAERRRSEE